MQASIIVPLQLYRLVYFIVPPKCIQRGQTALQLAATKNYAEVARVLLDAKADVNLQEKVPCDLCMHILKLMCRSVVKNCCDVFHFEMYALRVEQHFFAP